TILFDDGAIVHAACGEVSGLKALFRMLGWSRAFFRMLPREEPVSLVTIVAPSTNALMDGLVSLDEWNRFKDVVPPKDSRLDEARGAAPRLETGERTEAERDVLARAAKGTTVGAILEESPLPDADLAEAICTLITDGVLAVTEPAKR